MMDLGDPYQIEDEKGRKRRAPLSAIVIAEGSLILGIFTLSYILFGEEADLSKAVVRPFLLASMNCAATLLALVIGATIASKAIVQEDTHLHKMLGEYMRLISVAVAFFLTHIIFAAFSYIIYNDFHASGLVAICLITFGGSLLVVAAIILQIIVQWDKHVYEKQDSATQSDNMEDK